MTRQWVSTVFLLCGLAAGCGAPRIDLPPAPPHGGTAFALPEGKGFVEVVRQDAPEKPGLTRLVIYFLDAERQPLRSISKAVSFKPKGRNAAPVALKPVEGTDPTKEGELASDPFRDPGEIVGVLLATIENQPISIAINLR
jgi:hypothetical protein